MGSYVRRHFEGRQGLAVGFGANFLLAVALAMAVFRGLALAGAPRWTGDLLILVVVLWSVVGNLRMAQRTLRTNAPVMRKLAAAGAAGIALFCGLFMQYDWLTGQ